MLPSASDLTYFLEVGQSGNISRAAERLGITQPSLSLSIKRLEDNLGAQLLIRSKNGVQLTATGKRFQGYARSLLDDWEKIKATTLNQETEIKGYYTLGCHPSVGLYTLPFFLQKLLENHPRLEMNLHHDLSRRITEDVISCRIDFGIVVNPVQHPDLVIRELCRDRVTLWTGGKKSEINDPKNDHFILIYDPDLIQADTIVKKLKKHGLSYARSIHSSNLEIITSLVASGVGIGVLPTRVATLNTGIIQLIPVADAPFFDDRICLVYRADSPKTAASRQIVEAIEQNIKDV